LGGYERAAEAVLTGTDASNWGTGQVLWLDGGREESSLAFTHAERRRPINWRELLGIVRVCTVGGERLRGTSPTAQKEPPCDNTASRPSSAYDGFPILTRRTHRKPDDRRAASSAEPYACAVTRVPGEDRTTAQILGSSTVI
jgi:hypothetical protein